LIQFDPSIQIISSALVIPIFIMAVPIIDTSVVVISRVLRGVSIFQGGRDHLSHRIIAQGVSRRNSALIIWVLGGIFSSIALVINQLRSPYVELLPFSGILLMTILVIYFTRLPVPK
jgi:UDP-GlcNAc:undecaprenyl-phosphate GlcNAc-1-phosphate transferase